MLNTPHPKKQKFSHVHPVYRRTSVVTSKQFVIDDETHVSLVCSCALTRSSFVACRLVYRIVRRLPIVQDFLPCCFKTYEIRHNKKDEYTSQADDMMTWYNKHGGIILCGFLDTVIPVDLLDDSSDEYFRGTIETSGDVNDRTSACVDQFVPLSANVLPGPLVATTKSGTLGQVANAQLRPTFNSIMDQGLSQDAIEIARNGLNRILADMYAFNKDNSKKGYKNLQKEIQPNRLQNTA